MNKINYITADELKNFNPETDFTPYVDVTISGMISRACSFIDNYIDYSLGLETIIGETSEANVTPDGDLIIFTKKVPIVSVSAISRKLGAYSSTLNLAESNGNTPYEIPEPKHHILYPYQEMELTGTVGINNFLQLRNRQFYTKITYSAGYQTIPDDIKDATNLLTKDIFMRQANPMNLSNISQGGISMAFATQEAGESDLIKDAKRILAPYIKYHY